MHSVYHGPHNLQICLCLSFLHGDSCFDLLFKVPVAQLKVRLHDRNKRLQPRWANCKLWSYASNHKIHLQFPSKCKQMFIPSPKLQHKNESSAFRLDLHNPFNQRFLRVSPCSLVFNLYMLLLVSVIKNSNISYRSYAGDISIICLYCKVHWATQESFWTVLRKQWFDNHINSITWTAFCHLKIYVKLEDS